MKESHLIPRKWGNTLHYDFRHRVPADLVEYFGGKRQFQISLNNVSNNETILVSRYLKNLLLKLFSDIRSGMKDLNLEDIKEILRTEVRKSILHSGHVSEGHNEIYDSMKKVESLEKVYSREINMRKSLLTEPKEVRESVDNKLQLILFSLDITLDQHSPNYKKLRSSFIDLYLLRFKWIKEMMDESGRTDDDFRREVDEKLKMNLFPELTEKLTPIIENFVPEPTQPYRIERPVSDNSRNEDNQIIKKSNLSTLQSIPISKCIEKYFDDKVEGDLRIKSEREVKHSLNLLIEEFGDIPIGTIDIEKGTKFKTDIKNLPTNRNKLPKFRDKSFHELMNLNIKNEEKISVVTFNKHIQYVSSFMNWCVIHGYSDVNPFKGMKQKVKTQPRDQRDRFTEQELKQIFNKDNYLYYTAVRDGRWENYWVPLISVFSGMRLGEICPLYLDNIKELKGNSRKKRWCIDILEEPERPDKKLKTLSSRRVVPIHDTLIELGLIEFIELLKKKFPERERLFQELPYGENSYNRNVSRFFNTRYLPKLGIKTSKKNFHSFRHTVSDHLKQKGVEPHFINELLGHSSGNIDLDRYGKGYNPDILFNKCVNKVVYETSPKRGIDFKSLKLNWEKLII